MAIDSRCALIMVDVQNDFCPGGELAVPGGDEVIPPLNALARRFADKGALVIATADWHPGGHVSFASSHQGKKAGDTVSLSAGLDQVLWPDHCVQGSGGAAFHGGLDLTPARLIIRKGYRKGLDSYSAFFENDRTTATGLDGFLKAMGIQRLFAGGLATDYCVLYSVLDAVRLGYETVLVRDAVRAVGYPEGSGEKALGTMTNAGVIFAESGAIG